MNFCRSASDRLRLVAWGVLGLAALGSGCASATDEARQASFAPFASVRIGGEPAADYLQARTAMVFTNAKWIETPTPEQPKLGKLEPTDPTGAFGIGTAAAIDHRGYFITAAHVVASGTPYLSYRINGGSTILPGRVVWRGDASKGEPDVAIVHVADRLERVFVWTPFVNLDDPAFAVGLVPATGELRAMAGKAMKLEGKAGHPRITTLTHDTPLRPGDSGGPVTNAKGELLGITSVLFGRGYRHGNTIFRLPFTRILATALKPDLVWVRRVIEDDATSHPTVRP